MGLILLLFGILLFALIFWYSSKAYNERMATINRLREDYENSLKGNDKSIALAKGRAYYHKLNEEQKIRDKPLYDTENIISNDLNGMDNAYRSDNK